MLFVAEKSVALDVVRRRLDAAGLGSLILDMHAPSCASATPTAGCPMRQRTVEQLVAQLLRLQSMEASQADSNAEALTDDFLADQARLSAIDLRLDAHAEWMHAAQDNAFRLPLFAALAEQAAIDAATHTSACAGLGGRAVPLLPTHLARSLAAEPLYRYGAFAPPETLLQLCRCAPGLRCMRARTVHGSGLATAHPPPTHPHVHVHA